MSKLLRIGLVMSWHTGYPRRVLQAICGYAQTHKKPWVFYRVDPEGSYVEALHHWQPHGIIALLKSRSMARKLKGLGCPVVEASNWVPGKLFPRVAVDSRAAGAAAARHLLDRGLRNFGYLGHPATQFSVEREEGFTKVLAEAGFRCNRFYDHWGSDREPIPSWPINHPALLTWLKSLAKPVGILAAHDTACAQLAGACRVANLRVPDEVALVGVGNDDQFCTLIEPTLSSVVVPEQEIGVEAARLLERLMSGRRPPRARILIPPGGVVARRSSDALALDDKDVAQAVRFIHAQAHRIITIDDVVQHVLISRRSLQRRFQQVLQRSILEEIHRAHVEHARHLLITTTLPIRAIALQSGFSASHRLTAAFRKELGITPSHYRKTFGLVRHGSTD